MKTYTLTWTHSPYYGSTRSRCRFTEGSFLWNERICDAVGNFAFRLSSMVEPLGVRLVSCGRLVARSATYQGV